MTATNPANSPSDCPECGAPLVAGAEKCWLCALKHERPIGSNDPATTPAEKAPIAVNPYASPAPPVGTNFNRTFSLSTMFLWTTLLAVLLGVTMAAPGLGIALAIVSLPAALMTIGTVGRRKRRTGRSMSPEDKVATFAAAFGVALVTSIAAGIAFTAVCFPIGAAGFGAAEHGDNSTMILGVVAGIVAGAAVWFFLIRLFWKVGD